MTNPAQSIPASPAPPPAAPAGAGPEGWERVRADSDIQFAPVDIPETPPAEPNWFERAMQSFFEFLGEMLSPIGSAIGYSWPVLKWVLLAAAIALILYLVLNSIGPIARRKREARTAEGEPEWVPDRTESLGLLEDADRLAAEGRYDEATHLLLKRSVRQIASARPDWVEPSSTARELAALPTLSDAARHAFATIAERVERSLFALRTLDKSDWEAARGAYADFALVRIGQGA